MFSFVRHLASRISVHERHDGRSARPADGPIARMMRCDVNNLDRLARALVEPRR